MYTVRLLFNSSFVCLVDVLRPEIHLKWDLKVFLNLKHAWFQNQIPERASEFTEGVLALITISLIYCATALVLCSVHLKVKESVFL